MKRNVKGDIFPYAGLACIHFLPAVCPWSQAWHVFKVDAVCAGRCTRAESDHDTILERTGPVGVDLTVRGSRGPGRTEGRGSFPERVLVDVDESLVPNDVESRGRNLIKI